MKLSKSILAIGAFALVAGVAAPALAAPPGPAGQLVGQLQLNGGQNIDSSGNNNGNTNGKSFEYVTGNVGNNVAAGNANQQTNEAYIEYGGATGDILAVAPQLNGFNRIDWSKKNSAGTGGSAFAWATGNVGSNTAAGNANQQSNDAVILNGNYLVGLTMGSIQLTGLSQYCSDGGNTATAGGSSFSHAIGNIGNNVAAGNANQQSNQLVVNNMAGLVASGIAPQAGTP